MRTLKLALGMIAAVTWSQAMAADITGAGSTFDYPIFAKWATNYKSSTGVGLNYQSIGSGGGIKQIASRTVDFGASDMPLTHSDLASKGLAQFPAIVGGVVPVVNLKGIHAGQIRLNGDVLAKIYLGEIKSWRDPAIAALNHGIQFPDELITVVRRADGSGTTFIFTNYLSKVNAHWMSKVGSGTAVAWPEGVAGKGNEGVASYVQRINGAIGYVEYAYAKVAKMDFLLMINKDGKTIVPDIKSFQAAAAYADWAHDQDFYEVLTNEPGATSWPITGASFVLVPQLADAAGHIKDVFKFFDWSFHKGMDAARSLDYVPLPDNVVKMIESSWKTAVHNAAGQSVW